MDPKDMKPGDARLANADVRGVLQQRGGLRPCPACNGGPWVIFEDPKLNAGITLMPNEGGLHIPPPNIPVTVLICSNCGFLRLHATLVLRSFLEGVNTPLSDSEDPAPPDKPEDGGNAS